MRGQRSRWRGITAAIRITAMLMLLALAAASLTFGADSALGEKSAVQKIESAYRAGKLNLEEATLLKVMAVLRPDEVPEPYRSTQAVDGKCATQVMAEAVRNMDRFSAETRAALAAGVVRPSNALYFDSPEGHFRIHYDVIGSKAVPTADTNANSIPDYVEHVADYADSTWRQQIVQYGYLTPPSDDTVGGGTGLYDIYCQNIPYYGYTQPETAGPAAWNDWTSFIAIHNNFIGFPPNTDPDGNQLGAAKVTVAHEFFHAVQFGYDVGEMAWWMEQTSTWMEDEVFDTVNDNYNYLTGVFYYPQIPLTFMDGWREYAYFIWPRFLSEVYGDSLIHSIWGLCKTTNAIYAFDSVLFDFSSSRDQSFGDFTTWNWITNTRDDGLHYEEGAAYPAVNVMRSHASYPVGPQTTTKEPGGLASNYIAFTPPPGAGERPLCIAFDGDDAYFWGLRLVAKRTGGSYESYTVPLDSLQAGAFRLPAFGDYDHAALIPAMLTVTAETANYEYSACIGPPAPLQISPADGASAPTPVVLEWDFDPQAVSYHLQVDDDPAFGSPAVDTLLLAAQLTIPGVPVGITHYWRVSLTDDCGEGAWSAAQSFEPECIVVKTGDVNGDATITAADIISMVGYVFRAGPPPQPIHQAGDVNCDGSETSADIVYLVAYVFRAGSLPCDVCSIL